MAAKKNSGLMVHVIVTVIGVSAAFFVGFKTAGSGQGDVDKQLGELKSSIETNATGIDANKKFAGDNSKRFTELSVNYTAFSDDVYEQLKPKPQIGIPASAGKGMTYVDSVLGLKWSTRYSDGHKYCLIPYPLPWKHAQDFARKVGGSLVVIDDEAENTWIVEKFGSSTEFWIGLTDERDEAKWIWVNDLALLYNNWATGEPDNYRKMQHYVILNKQAGKGAEQPGKWNDITGNEIKIGIIEVNR